MCEKLSEFEHSHHTHTSIRCSEENVIGASSDVWVLDMYTMYVHSCPMKLVLGMSGRYETTMPSGFTPRPPILARAQGWERAAPIRAKNMFCCQIVRCKNCAGNDVVQSHPTAVDGNLLHENLQIWSSNNQLANLRSGLFRWFSGGVGRQLWLDMTAAGHPSTSSTTDHHAIIMPGLTLCTTVYNVALGVEWGVLQVIKLIAWGRMSSCNVPSPDTSSLSLASHQLYHLLLLISFWLNWLSSLSPLLLQIIAKENCLSFLLGFWSPSITLRLNFYATSLLSWFLTLLVSGNLAQSRGWLTDNDWVKHSTFHSCTVHGVNWICSVLLQFSYTCIAKISNSTLGK